MGNQGKLVLLIDDNKLPMQFYIKALKQEGFEVEQCFEPDSALDFVEKNKEQIAVIILDIMMPPGKTYNSKDTKEGLKTGNFLYDGLRALCPNTPILVLTNVNQPETLKKFYDLGIDVKQKISCPPFELVELIDEMLLVKDKKAADNQTLLKKNGEQKREYLNGS